MAETKGKSGKVVPIWLGKTELEEMEIRAARVGLEVNRYVKEVVLKAPQMEDESRTLTEELRIIKALLTKLVLENSITGDAPSTQLSARIDPRIDELQGQVFAVSEGLKTVMMLLKTVLGDLGTLKSLASREEIQEDILKQAQAEEARRKQWVQGLVERFVALEKDTLEKIQNA